MPSRDLVRRILRDARAVRCVQTLGLLGALLLAAPAMAQTSYVVEDLGVLPGDSSSVA